MSGTCLYGEMDLSAWAVVLPAVVSVTGRAAVSLPKLVVLSWVGPATRSAISAGGTSSCCAGGDGIVPIPTSAVIGPSVAITSGRCVAVVVAISCCCLASRLVWIVVLLY